MGFGVVGATALLAATVLSSAYAVTGALLDVESQIRESRMVLDTLQADQVRTLFTVSLAHNNGAGHVTLTIRNTGGVTTDAADFDVLLDGVAYTGADITVNGHTGTLLHPGETLTMFFHGTLDLGSVFRPDSPTRAAVSTSNGAMGFWSP